MENLLIQLNNDMDLLSSRIKEAREGFVLKITKEGTEYKNYNDYRKLSISLIDMFRTYQRLSRFKKDVTYQYYIDFIKNEILKLSELIGYPKISASQYSCLSSIYTKFINELDNLSRDVV